MGCKMKKTWKCKSAVLLMAAAMVLADRIPGMETGMPVYAKEKKMPKELIPSSKWNPIHTSVPLYKQGVRSPYYSGPKGNYWPNNFPLPETADC